MVIKKTDKDMKTADINFQYANKRGCCEIF